MRRMPWCRQLPLPSGPLHKGSREVEASRCALRFLDRNKIADAGSTSLASALRGGALPALKRLLLDENPASQQARDAVLAVRPGLVGSV